MIALRIMDPEIVVQPAPTFARSLQKKKKLTRMQPLIWIAQILKTNLATLNVLRKNVKQPLEEVNVPTIALRIMDSEIVVQPAPTFARSLQKKKKTYKNATIDLDCSDFEDKSCYFECPKKECEAASRRGECTNDCFENYGLGNCCPTC